MVDFCAYRDSGEDPGGYQPSALTPRLSTQCQAWGQHDEADTGHHDQNSQDVEPDEHRPGKRRARALWSTDGKTAFWKTPDSHCLPPPKVTL